MMKIKNGDGSDVTIEQLEAMVPPLRKFDVVKSVYNDRVEQSVIAHKDSSTASGTIIFTRVDIDRLNVCLHERTVLAANNIVEYAEDCSYVDETQSKLVKPSIRDRFRMN